MKFNYSVVKRSTRKSAQISVFPDQQVSIAVPPNFSKKRIETLVRKESDWIVQTLKDYRRRYVPYKPKRFVSGEKFAFLGDEYSLTIVKEPGACVYTHDDELVVSIPEGLSGGKRKAYIRDQLIAWYRDAAKNLIEQRVKFFGKKLGLTHNRLTIKTMRTQWGSCSNKRNLNFNWALVMAPLHALDYIVVHELCHLRYFNHSQSFWDLVARVLPDYQSSKQWLDEQGYLLKV